jgi:hypothetical protein
MLLSMNYAQVEPLSTPRPALEREGAGEPIRTKGQTFRGTLLEYGPSTRWMLSHLHRLILVYTYCRTGFPRPPIMASTMPGSIQY